MNSMTAKKLEPVPTWMRTATLSDAIEHGLSEKEYHGLVELLGRELNMIEVGVCSALYSEHCSYKSSKVHLKTLPTEGPRVIHGPGENAGVVDIGDNQAIVFKVESHNHPSFIEPFQGAATGVGGILRDVFTMGARPLALMNALRFGEEANLKTKYLTRRAVAGIGFYGNCIGVPTVGGELMFHSAYNGNCLVNAFALGLVDQDKIFLGSAAGVGNSVIYVGSKTGRDGIHGATMSSEAFDDDSEEKRPTVQVGDPFAEKLLLEACLEVFQTGSVIGVQDMGAAGMTSSTYEMADRAGTGVRIDLEKVPQRESGMNPYEIMLSESQERMLFVVARGREEEALKIVRRWELDGVKIGEVIEGKNVELCWHGEVVSSLPVSLVTASVPQYRLPEQEPEDFQSRLEYPVLSIGEPEDLSQFWLDFLGSLNVCSRSPVFRQYDSTVRSNTVVHPGGDAAVIRIKSNSRKEKGIAMTLDCNSRYCAIDPREGTALSLAEACRNIAAVGATPIAISDCLNFGSPARPVGMWELASSIRGLGDAARALEVPIVSGNVSLNNETKGVSVLPTPMLAVVGLIEDASKSIGANFVADGDQVLVFGETREADLGGSEYLAVFAGVEKGRLPVLDYEAERRTADLVRELIGLGLLQSCHDISSGGLAVALAESCFGVYGSHGASLKVESYSGRKDSLLFAETGARYLVSLKPGADKQVRALAEKRGVPVTLSGKVGGSTITVEGYASIEVDTAYATWKNSLERLFAT